MRNWLFLLVLMIVLRPLAASGVNMESSTVKSGELAGSAWVLSGLPDRALVPDAPVTLRFSDDRVTGSDGCNRFTMAYEADGEALTIDPRGPGTRMACPPPVETQAAAVRAALGDARSAQRDDGRLTLYDAGGEPVATFDAQDENLAGTRWEVTDYNTGQGAVTGILPGTWLTLEFSPDGRVSGSAGCNRLMGRYAVTGDGVEIGTVAATRRYCARPEGVMEQEAALLAALEGSHTARFEADRLELRDGSGALRLAARRTPPAAALGGEFQYLADAARFTECRSGRDYPVAMEDDYVTAERAYLAAVQKPGSPLYVTLEGHFEQRPAMEGAGLQESLVIDRFIHAWPDETCERARADADIMNTYWRIVRLGDTDINKVESRREPHLVVTEPVGAPHYRATAGCNQLTGAVEVSGDTVRFRPGPATLKACPPPVDDEERRLTETLSEARRLRILGNTLELFNEAGRSIALFQAVYF